MRTSTYILQAFAMLLMLAAITIGHYAAVAGNTALVLLNTFLFTVNLSLFIWQSRIRAKLPLPSHLERHT